MRALGVERGVGLVELRLAPVQLGLHVRGPGPQRGLLPDQLVDLGVLAVDRRLQPALLVDVRLELVHLALELRGRVLGRRAGGEAQSAQRDQGQQWEYEPAHAAQATHPPSNVSDP